MEYEPEPHSKEENEQLINALRYMEEVRLREFSIEELMNMLEYIETRDDKNEELLIEYFNNGTIIDFCREAVIKVLGENGIIIDGDEL